MIVHELEVVEPLPGQRLPWLRVSREQFWPAFEAAGARVVAVFGTVFGRTSEVTTLYEYPDTAAWERTRLRAATPGKGFPGQDECAALSARIENRLLVPSPYWPLKPIPRDGLFTSRVFTIEPGALENFHRSTAEVIWPQGENQEGAQFLGLWTAAVGHPNEVVMLVRYQDFGHWDELHPQAGLERDEKMVAWLNVLRARDRTTNGTEVRILRRLPGWPAEDR
jgi:hypothetical protein